MALDFTLSTPKTPAHRRTRSDAKHTPLTPTLIGGIANIALGNGPASISTASSFNVSPTKPRLPGAMPRSRTLNARPGAADTSNPFLMPSKSNNLSNIKPSKSSASLVSKRSTSNIRSTSGGSRAPSQSRSRPASPIKRASGSSVLQVTDSLASQASSGLIKRGGIEARMDVIQIQPASSSLNVADAGASGPPSSTKRSKSMTNLGRTDARFIPAPSSAQDLAYAASVTETTLPTSSPGHTARLAAATGVPAPGSNRRILAYHEAPPVPSIDPALAEHRKYAQPLYARPASLASNTGVDSKKGRKITGVPERVLDAPGMMDDFYLNLIDWSAASTNCVAVALGDATYIWNAQSGTVSHLGSSGEGEYVSSVAFSQDGQFLGIGLGSGTVELWDVSAGVKLRTMPGHLAQVACMSWFAHLLSSGSGDGSIWHHDVRVARHKVMELNGHAGEVCGLQWRADGELLASGGNDNVVNIWDGRVSDAVTNALGEPARGTAKWTKRSHTAAVKAISWCPWQPSLLASGGGTNDASVNVWNSTTGARLHTLKTPSQITSIQWAPHRKEFLTTHGYPTNSLMVHAYPSLEKVAEIRDAHDARVLFSAVSPNGDVVCTGAGDENLKFWRIWELPPSDKKKTKSVKERSMTGSGGILALR